MDQASVSVSPVTRLFPQRVWVTWLRSAPGIGGVTSTLGNRQRNWIRLCSVKWCLGASSRPCSGSFEGPARSQNVRTGSHRVHLCFQESDLREGDKCLGWWIHQKPGMFRWVIEDFSKPGWWIKAKPRELTLIKHFKGHARHRWWDYILPCTLKSGVWRGPCPS
jgi:hypothetical protein